MFFQTNRPHCSPFLLLWYKYTKLDSKKKADFQFPRAFQNQETNVPPNMMQDTVRAMRAVITTATPPIPKKISEAFFTMCNFFNNLRL